MLRTRSPRKEKISNCYLHSNSLSNKMDNSLLAVRDINHKYIVVESGEDILDLVNHAVEDTGKVPKEYKQQMKNWIHDLVSTMSVKGWNNVSDMTLSILYGKGGLKDMKQLISYQCDADNRKRAWYSVT